MLVKNKALAYVIRFFRRLIELLSSCVLCLMYCGRSKKLADIEDPILLESAQSLAAKIRRGEVSGYFCHLGIFYDFSIYLYLRFYVFILCLLLPIFPTFINDITIVNNAYVISSLIV